MKDAIQELEQKYRVGSGGIMVTMINPDLMSIITFRTSRSKLANLVEDYMNPSVHNRMANIMIMHAVGKDNNAPLFLVRAPGSDKIVALGTIDERGRHVPSHKAIIDLLKLDNLQLSYGDKANELEKKWRIYLENHGFPQGTRGYFNISAIYSSLRMFMVAAVKAAKN